MAKYKYLLIFLLPATVSISFYFDSWISYSPVLLLFVIVPVFEFLLPVDRSNIKEENKELVENDRFYSILLYAMVPLQICFLIWYLTIDSSEYSTSTYIARTIAMGVMCGVIGINVGHELGHRINRVEQFLGEILLLTSLNTHFLPYHNRGHHYDVGTLEDPATARLNEVIYVFWIRSHFGSYLKAWKIENMRMKIMDKPFYSLSNRMIHYTIAQIVLLGIIGWVLGIWGVLSFILVSVIGILLLETVNYIEHYGLMREKTSEDKYERVRLTHSWNSNQILGRVILFELCRHSDHHYQPDRPYQVLEFKEGSPEMPTGYPGMMLLTLIPPLFFKKVNPIIKKI